jgi:hypothetical protein
VCGTGETGKRGGRGFKLAELIDQRLELLQPCRDLLTLCVQKITHQLAFR